MGTQDRDKAEEAAGYRIVTPSNLPEGMVLVGYLVDGAKSDNKSDAVDQYWHMPGRKNSRQWISVMQRPRRAGLIGNESTTISGITSERVYYESDSERPYPIVEFKWHHEGGFLSFSGTIVNSQTEETIKLVADSLISE